MNDFPVREPVPGAGSTPDLQGVAFGSLIPVPMHTLHPCQGQVVVLVDEPYVDRVDRGVAVIVDTADGTITALVDGTPRTLLPGERVVEITDLRTVLALNREALDYLAASNRAAAGRLREVTSRAQAAHRSQRERLAEIRAYAIERYRRGESDRPGLDEFLARFDLGAYPPPHGQTFTAGGGFEAGAADGGHE